MFHSIRGPNRLAHLFAEDLPLPAAPVVDSLDVRVRREGSLFLFDALTERAEAWITDHVSADAPRFGGALVVEHRFAAPLAHGMVTDGLRLAQRGARS